MLLVCLVLELCRRTGTTRGMSWFDAGRRRAKRVEGKRVSREGQVTGEGFRILSFIFFLFFSF